MQKYLVGQLSACCDVKDGCIKSFADSWSHYHAILVVADPTFVPAIRTHHVVARDAETVFTNCIEAVCVSHEVAPLSPGFLHCSLRRLYPETILIVFGGAYPQASAMASTIFFGSSSV